VGAPGAEGRVPCPLVRIVCPSGSFAGPPWKAGVRHGVWGHGVNATAPFLAPHEGGAPPSHDLAARPLRSRRCPGPRLSGLPGPWQARCLLGLVPGCPNQSRIRNHSPRDHCLIPAPICWDHRASHIPPSVEPRSKPNCRPHRPAPSLTSTPPPPPPSPSQWAPCVRVTAPSNPLPHRLTALPVFHAMRLSSHPSAAQSWLPPLPPLSKHHTAPRDGNTLTPQGYSSCAYHVYLCQTVTANAANTPNSTPVFIT